MPQSAEPLKTFVKKLLLKKSNRKLDDFIDKRKLEKELLYVNRMRVMKYPANYVIGFSRLNKAQVTLECAGFTLRNWSVESPRPMLKERACELMY